MHAQGFSELAEAVWLVTRDAATCELLESTPYSGEDVSPVSAGVPQSQSVVVWYRDEEKNLGERVRMVMVKILFF